MRVSRILAALLILSGFALASDPPVPERVKADPGPERLTIYDVRDLVTPARSLEDLVARVRVAIAGEGKIQAAADSGALIVKAPARTHARVRGLLATLRHQLSLIVTVEPQIIRTRGPIAPMVPERGMLALNPDQSKRLLAGLGEKAQVVATPRISCWDGHRGTISVLTQVAYVGDFEVEVAGDESVLANPIVESLDEGVTIALKPVVSRDRKFVTLLLETTVSSVRRPIEKVALQLGPGVEVSVQVPEIVKRSWRRALTMPVAGHVLLDLGRIDEDTGERLAILLTANLCDLANVEEPTEKK